VLSFALHPVIRPLASLVAAFAALIGAHALFSQDGNLLGQLVLAAVTVIGFYVSSRERRHQRDALKAEIQLAQLHLAEKAAEAAAAAQQAYHEANDANTKIAQLQQQLEARQLPGKEA